MTSRLDRWERVLDRQLAAAPYVLLAVSVGLALADGAASPWIMLGLAASAVGWVWLVPRGPVYVAGLVLLIGVLCGQSMWFASFFGFIGYLHSWRYLKGLWRFAGVTGVAAISVAAYNGGLPEPTPSAILTYVFFTGAIAAGVALFSFLGQITDERSSERERMVAQLEEAMRENAGLHAQLLVQAREAGVLDERRRMAAEIHDTLAQGLTGIITQLQAAGQADDWRRNVDLALRLARESLAEARRSVHAMGPGPLESAPLTEALRDVADRWGELNGLAPEFTVTGPARPLHPEVEETLLRTAQEALVNVAKHAHASRVGLTLSYMEDVVTLDVRDDGIGFDPQLTAFGLTAMRKRLDRLAGTLEIESESGAGTAISASLPAVARG
ncbi:Signal transduction histidine-protein kinase/phosphatase DegS [Nonomuraea coxensis DSM 45129]|uniref:Signal transduction histidine-protein kinase/phosphatase DegS n=1 Tax=Nonomuraea coxensis DSM 45129 TaxID=1122611 RepID=A0ABX8UFP2_9ACTN|nr:sensor histidine kinase [Nonomuraea coxensis]QYC45459.1 Signal transduction histidine-protein kinase/phosphatase DegS [Nonomuraea coxensis DSM 45129]